MQLILQYALCAIGICDSNFIREPPMNFMSTYDSRYLAECYDSELIRLTCTSRH